MVKAATKVDLYPRVYLDDVNFGWLLEQAGINGLKGWFHFKIFTWKSNAWTKFFKDFYLDDETCVPLGARIFGRYVITPNAAIEKPCMIPSVPVIHPFKNLGLLDQAFKGLLYFAKTPCELPGPKEPDLPPQQQNVGERENFARVYPKGLESDQEQSTSWNFESGWSRSLDF